jgi:ubiquinone/menaquinone biosynthesis C-methylase UbiE
MRDDNYPLAASPAEIKRLRVQAESLAGEAAIMLDRIGVTQGTRCLDLGCGAGGITDLLSARVGPTGRVIGMDVEDFSLAAARNWADDLGLDNVDFQHGSLFENELELESFDLVHLRYVVTTIGRHDEVIASALKLVKPGGVLAFQEADAEGINVYPDAPTFGDLKKVLIAVFAEIGADPFAGRKLYSQLKAQGLDHVDVRVCTARARAHDDLADYLPQTILSVREVIHKLDLMTEEALNAAINLCREHLSNPDVISTSSTVFQAWGRKG